MGGRPNAATFLTLHICEFRWRSNYQQHAQLLVAEASDLSVPHMMLTPHDADRTLDEIGSLRRIRDDYYIGCGGALVRPRLVVTAGACLACAAPPAR
jgi:hypothetical protein